MAGSIGGRALNEQEGKGRVLSSGPEAQAASLLQGLLTLALSSPTSLFQHFKSQLGKITSIFLDHETNRLGGRRWHN